MRNILSIILNNIFSKLPPFLKSVTRHRRPDAILANLVVDSIAIAPVANG